jgi:two-component system, chemotaxis family, sensor kinase CheA
MRNHRDRRGIPAPTMLSVGFFLAATGAAVANVWMASVGFGPAQGRPADLFPAETAGHGAAMCLALHWVALTAIVALWIISRYQSRRRDRVLRRFQTETATALGHADSAIFCIDERLRIVRQYSDAGFVFGRQSVDGLNLRGLLGSALSPESGPVLERYLGVLFLDRINPCLVEDLNPLDQLEFTRVHADGSVRRQHLAFRFAAATWVDGQRCVLVTVRDTTERAELSRELLRLRDKHEKEVELMASVAAGEAPLLGGLVTRARIAVASMKQALNVVLTDTAAAKRALGEIGVEVRAIQRDAEQLHLDAMSALCRELDEETTRVGDIGAPRLGLSELKARVHELSAMIRIVETMIGKRPCKHAAAANAGAAARGGEQAFNHLVSKLAQQEGKHVALSCVGWSLQRVSISMRDILQLAAIQLIRNAIVHGIEKPEQRASAGKSPLGHVWIALSEPRSGEVQLVVRDDGCGIDTADLRGAAPANADAAANVMAPGRAMLTAIPSRRFGLDTVRRAVGRAGGRFGLRTRPGVYTEFTIALPAGVVEKSGAAEKSAAVLHAI